MAKTLEELVRIGTFTEAMDALTTLAGYKPSDSPAVDFEASQSDDGNATKVTMTINGPIAHIVAIMTPPKRRN